MLNRNSTLLLATLIVNNIAVAALNDTGITTCSNATQNGLPCLVSGNYAKATPIPKTAGQWTATGSMNTMRYGHTATLLPNGNVLVTGGYNGNLLNSAELYDPNTATWSNTAAMNTARGNHTATLLPNGKVLIVGGAGGGTNYHASAEMYDPETRYWSNTGALSRGRVNHTSILLANGKVLIVGGYSPNTIQSSAEVYDPATEIWSSAGSMSKPRIYNTTTLLDNGKVLVVGGSDNSYHQLTSAELYDTSTGIWNITGSLSVGRQNHTATMLANGKVLVAGGTGSSRTANTELYDTNTGTWSNTVGTLNMMRYWHTANLLLNGEVLVAGSRDGLITKVELYDPSTGYWSNTGSLGAGRHKHTATPLANGKVLVVGGIYMSSNGADNFPYPNAEVYDSGALAPTAITNVPSVITNTSASLSGTVNSNGATTDVSFDFGTSTSYDQNIVANPASITDIVRATSISAHVTGLSCNTYHYRVKATNSIGTTLGNDQTFSTTCTPLTNGNAVTNQTVASAAWNYYSIDIPSGADNLVFTTTGSSGDIDIYTQFAAMPTENAYLCLSDLEGSNETCTHPSPTAGTWWLGVLGYSGGDYTVTASFRQPQTIGTITFDPTSLFVGDTATASATATSGLAVTFTTTTSDICSINGITITALTAGTCTIAANQAGDTAYVPATQQTATIEISKKTQTIGSISFSPASLTYGDSGSTASASADSSLTVTFTSTTPSVCNATGNNGATITINTAGTCTIAADQAGDNAYLPAAQVTSSITINQANQTITLTCNPTSVEATKTATCNATATSNLTVNLATITPDICSLSNGTVTGIIPGTCTITANHSGDTNYLAAAQTTADITITKANQTITLNCSPVTIAVNATATCSAVATSGLTPSMSTALTPSICSISNGTVTGLATGTCTVSSKQVGNNIYNPAPQVTTNIAVGISSYTVTATAGSGGSVTPPSKTVTSGATATFTVTPATGYNRNPAVGGTCPAGSWNSNVWTTGAITANCSVIFSFTIKTYTINPSAGSGGSFTPTGIQTVNHGTTKSFTVTANTGYSTNTAVTGTCPQGTWNGNIWTTGAIIANCSVSFSFIDGGLTVTATAGSGGTVTPSGAQNIPRNTTKTFTVTPNTGYNRNPAVGGTCPQGSWSGGSTSSPSAWTTGTITANCTVTFGFTIKTYTVTATAGSGGSITPTGIQTVNYGTTKSFTVTANSGYAKNTAVTGTCPQGTWTGNVWKTGAIIANCTVTFGFTPLPANAWLNPPSQTIIRNQPFTLGIIAKSDSVKVGSYSFVVTLDATKLVLDTSQCPQGVCPGANAVDNRVNIVNATGNKITLTGSDNTGVGPGNDLQLLIMHFKTKLVTGATSVTLTTSALDTPEGGNIGLQARGATVNVSYGLCGDADGNLRINIVDALAIARKLVGLPPPPTVDVTLADVNENSRLDINDALMIARYSVGLVLPPEVCTIGVAL